MITTNNFVNTGYELPWFGAMKLIQGDFFLASLRCSGLGLNLSHIYK